MEVLVALRNCFLSAGMIPHIPELFGKHHELVVTELSSQALIDLGCVMERIPVQEVPFEVVGPDVTSPGEGGALLPDIEGIRDLIEETFGEDQ